MAEAEAETEEGRFDQGRACIDKYGVSHISGLPDVNTVGPRCKSCGRLLRSSTHLFIFFVSPFSHLVLDFNMLLGDIFHGFLRHHAFGIRSLGSCVNKMQSYL